MNLNCGGILMIVGSFSSALAEGKVSRKVIDSNEEQT